MQLVRAPIVATLLALSGCATLQQVLALRNVEFTVDRVSDLHLGGVDLERVTSFADVGFADAERLTRALAQRDLRLDFELHVLAENPADNTVDARLVRLDWTLLLQGRETLSGVFAEATLLRPGQPTDVPITISLNLIEFFDGSARDLVELALSLAGRGGAPKEVTLRATPIVDTALGPIRYPRPITIVSRQVGQ